MGPAGWSYRDWEGVVYPARPGRDFDRLRWIARLFDFVEINVSFYRLPRPEVSESWAERTSDTDFRFAAKLPARLTHDRVWDERLLRDFESFLDPLAQHDQLQWVLAQFPWSFRPSRESVDLLRRLTDRLAPLRVAHELRHGDWAAPRWREALAGLHRVTVDQPAVGNALGPEFPAHGDVYLRLHGRNAAAWFAPDVGRDARYDYLYGEEEVRSWARRVAELLDEGRSVTVVTNNHFEGQAVLNAIEIDTLLGRPKSWVPAGLLRKQAGAGDRLAALGASPVAVERPDALEGASTSERPRRNPQGELF